MKTKLVIVAAALLVLGASATAATKAARRTVVYQSTIHCKNCAKKVTENVGFEKGVEDLSTDLSTKTITVVFNETKTDTARIADAIRKTGFGAKVISYR